MGTSRSEFMTVQVQQCPFTCLNRLRCFTFFTLELVYEVEGFAVGKGGDGITEAGVGAGERLSGMWMRQVL